VAGIPLPLISYGGSSLAITLWSLGIVSNIYARRYALL
jgi:cell division protein FtsW (lipid II flippase)